MAGNTLRITGGKVYDPANGIDGAIRDLMKRRVLITGQRADVDSFEETTSRRADSLTRNHCGRVLFVIGPQLTTFPDLLIGPAESDLCLAAMARKLAGKRWTLRSSSDYEPDCEIPPGCIFHEKHESAWLSHGFDKANAHNAKIVAQWFRENMPKSMPEHLKDK